MKKVGRPTGLIGYDTDENITRRLDGKKSRYRPIRARTIAYTIILLAVGAVMLWGMTHRSVLDMNVLRDRIPNYVRLSDGSVRNGYTVKILNKRPETRKLKLEVTGFDNNKSGIDISVVGLKKQDGFFILEVPADETWNYKIYIALTDTSHLSLREDFAFKLTDMGDGETTQTPSLFVTGQEK